MLSNLFIDERFDGVKSSLCQKNLPYLHTRLDVPHDVLVSFRRDTGHKPQNFELLFCFDDTAFTKYL